MKLIATAHHCSQQIVCCKFLFYDIITAIHTETQMVDRHTGESVHKDLGCFVVVVTSHGDEGSIVGSDHKNVKITDMIDLLSAKNFPELKGKPKIIILQACAGGEC